MQRLHLYEFDRVLLLDNNRASLNKTNKLIDLKSESV